MPNSTKIHDKSKCKAKYKKKYYVAELLKNIYDRSSRIRSKNKKYLSTKQQRMLNNKAFRHLERPVLSCKLQYCGVPNIKGGSGVICQFAEILFFIILVYFVLLLMFFSFITLPLCSTFVILFTKGNKYEASDFCNYLISVRQRKWRSSVACQIT